MHIIYDDHPEDGEASPQANDICDPLMMRLFLKIMIMMTNNDDTGNNNYKCSSCLFVFPVQCQCQGRSMSLVPVIILTVGQCQKIGFYVENISKQEATDKSLK